MTLAPRETGHLLTRTLIVHTTYSRPPWPPDKRAAQDSSPEARTVPGQVVSCGNLIIIHGTRTCCTADSTSTSALLDAGTGTNAICFRRTRRDLDTVVEVFDHVAPLVCVPTEGDAPGVEARQLTACETRFTVPTPTPTLAVAARREGPGSDGEQTAEWKIYLPDGRTLQEVSVALAEYEGYGLSLTPMRSVCYARGDPGYDDGNHLEGEHTAVVCHPAGGDPSAGEIGRLML